MNTMPMVLAEIRRQHPYIGANIFISSIGMADKICRMSIGTLWGLHGIAYSKSPLQ
jgi:hypothetical protein